MAEINTQWFKGVLSDKELSQRQLAQRLGLDPAAVSLMFRGKRKIQMDEAARMATVLGIPLNEVIAHAGIASDLAAASLIGDTAVVGLVNGQMEVLLGDVPGPKRVPVPAELGESVCALRFVTFGSAIDDMDGAVAFFQPRKDVKADCVGRYCIVELAGNGPKLYRHVRRGYGAGRYNLTASVADGPLEEVSLVSASPVLWLKMP